MLHKHNLVILACIFFTKGIPEIISKHINKYIAEDKMEENNEYTTYKNFTCRRP